MNRNTVVKATSVVALTVTLATQQGTIGASIDDDIPIRETAQVAVDDKEKSWNTFKEEIESLEIETAEASKTKIRKVAVQETDVAVKNQAPYTSTLVDPEVEMKVYTYFSDIPEMIYVAECESTFRHYGSDGEVLRGRAVSADVGVMQINEYYHLERAQELGYDIHTLEGNLEYARLLYEDQGLQPWSASRPCWSKKHSVAQL